ncbi:MAG: SDR family NAD(P)-dependent oxidoreductase [Candidatus Nanopelagicaceae bacterium]|nr:SDR family NAD(P)-dependent oxidoreductase [Candidatus Nanopelagicaceae bacterium]
MEELVGKVALVTGANRGIGRIISFRLAKAGAQLVLAGRNQEGLEETARMIREENLSAEKSPLICRIDLLDPSSIDISVEEVLKECGRIDILVNNSGITGNSAPLWEQSESDWDETIDTNLKGPFLLTKAVIPSMIAQKSGSIIFIGSVTGKRPFINRSIYAASKLGLVGMMRTLALELGTHGIRVNLISPGFVAGPRLDGVIHVVAEQEKISPEEEDVKMRAMIPTGQFVTPENIAEGVLFFASDRSIGITGDDLNISGGLVMY